MASVHSCWSEPSVDGGGKNVTLGSIVALLPLGFCVHHSRTSPGEESIWQTRVVSVQFAMTLGEAECWMIDREEESAGKTEKERRAGERNFFYGK